MKRAIHTAVAAMLAAATVLFVGPTTPAQALSIDAQCSGTFSRSFSPAVTNMPQSVTVTETSGYNTCLVGPTVAGAASLIVTLSCIPVTAGPAFTETITWQDATGGTSTISWAAPTVVAQTVVFTGTVTAGRHAGDDATKVTTGVSYIGVVVPCLLGTPVSSTTGLIDSLLLTH